MRVAIIPARGGSKRIPNKNIRAFLGRPMVQRAVDTALRSALFDRVIVSTDDERIRAAAIDAGASAPFLRPAELSEDHTATVPVVAHALEQDAATGVRATHACCIYPCTPLLEPGDLKQAWAIAQRDDVDFVYAVAAYPHPVQRAFRMSPEGALEYVDASHAKRRTQDLEALYYDAAQFYWGTVRAWLGQPNGIASVRGYKIPSWRAIDIDTEDDWQHAELVFRALNRMA